MADWIEREVSGWGRYPRVQAQVTRPERRAELFDAFADRDGSGFLAHGLGRSYGDAATLDGGRVVFTRRLDRMLEFDPTTGWLRCEAGVSIEDILDVFVPRGFFPPVTPGTKFVTVGGALANDVHGKSHHVDGCWSNHVRRVELLTASGDVVTCDALDNPDLFRATVGGCGLTGVILAMDVQLRRADNAYFEMETTRVENLDHFFEVSEQGKSFTHTMSWIDCIKRGKGMGRGIFMAGHHAAPTAVPPPGKRPGLDDPTNPLRRAVSRFVNVPVDGPDWLLNKASMSLFNEVYFRRHPKGHQRSVVHYDPFFYPLDAVKNWNRIYGDRGFLQYQLVVPRDPGNTVMRTVLEAITKSGMGSFLAVIKEFGERDNGMLSFPMPGVTLALDFPNHGQPLLELFTRLDDIVADAGGRVYLGKDARLGRDHFRRMYPEWEAWKTIRDEWDPDGVFQSDLGRRLGLVEARGGAK